MSSFENTINYNYYLTDKDYKDSSKLLQYWNQMQDFYEGKQIAERYPQDLPRFVGNICKYLINTKASKVRGTPYVISFQSANREATDKLDKFDKFILQDIKYETELQESIINALIYGNEIVMYRFSDFNVSLDAVYEGKLVREHIDLRRFAVANPFLPDLQKQKWVMYWNKLEVEAVRERCQKFAKETQKEFEERVKSIVPDDFTDEKYPDQNYVAHGLVTVYTRYFRKNGEVCFQSSTKNVDLFEPRFLNSKVNEKLIKECLEYDNKVEDYDIDTEDANIEAKKDKMTNKEYQSKLSKFSLYPFADFTPNRRFNHFYGISDIQDCISAQKIMNFLYSMSAKNIQDNAWGKWVAKEGALRGQKINNNGGQVLIDYSKGNSFGIQRSEANSGNMITITNYTENIFALIRTLYGATEAITGENASNLSGYAISLLQEQGNTVFEMLQSQLWNDFAVSEAQIRLQFYLHYYDDKTPFIFELDDIEYDREVAARSQLIENDLVDWSNNPQGRPEPKREDYKPVEKVREEEFSSNEIIKNKYYIIPKAGRGIKYSEVVQADQINSLFKDGTVANLPMYLQKAYIELNPLIDETTRSKYKKIIETQEMSENQRLNNQVQELTSQLEQQTTMIKNLQNALSQANQYNKSLQQQFKEKLASASEENKIKTQALNSIAFEDTRNNKGNQQKQKTSKTDEMLRESAQAEVNG